MATVGELDAKALVDIVADKLSEIKAETLGYTLGHVDFGELFNTLTHTHTQCDAKAYVLINVLPYMLAGIRKKTHAGTPEEMWRSRRWLIV